MMGIVEMTMRKLFSTRSCQNSWRNAGLQCTTTQGIFRKRITLWARMFLELRDIR
ncbi:hypothetical protein N431DRAFT_144677 [Stipitochalara longipes BDJ]|nr:hypothetical protein N431DRAFT_144677 [Stipitochalara longipes BDJ]